MLTDFAANANDFSGAAGVVIQTDGKIVTAGRVGLDGGRFALIRYDTDGTLDTHVRRRREGGDELLERGRFRNVHRPPGGREDRGRGRGRRRQQVRARALQHRRDARHNVRRRREGDHALPQRDPETEVRGSPTGSRSRRDGKIVAAGTADFQQFALARYEADGSLDDTFGGDGRVLTSLSDGSDWAAAVIVQTDGKIVAAGTAGSTEFSGTFALARYDTDGTLDDTFGGDGKVRTDFNAEQDVAFALAQQADGKIVAAGGGDASGGRAALARYDTDGSLDSTFSSDGKVRTDFTAGIDAARGVAIQADGKIVTAGHGGYRRFALARYDADGSLDATFGAGGKVLTNFIRQSGLTLELATGIALQADGKIVAAGMAGVRSDRFALARYLGA